jgi:hypothetical protein
VAITPGRVATQARLAEQFELMMHVDETLAVEPFERTAECEAGAVPETFPFGV